MRLIKAILVGLIAVFSHELAWEMAVKGVSKDGAKLEAKTKTAPVSSKFRSSRWPKNHWAARKNDTQFDLPILITKG